jgi:membrane protein YdbS with pleckstrin-like domain
MRNFNVRIEPTERYFYWSHMLAIVLIGIWVVGLGLVVALIYALTWGKRLPQQQVAALRYWLDGTTLRVDQGVYFLKRKAIPLDRVTDVVLAQGPLMRHCGIWSLNIQTAGASAQAVAEAILYGIEDPERVRDELLRARDEAVLRARA